MLVRLASAMEQPRKHREDWSFFAVSMGWMCVDVLMPLAKAVASEHAILVARWNLACPMLMVDGPRTAAGLGLDRYGRPCGHCWRGRSSGSKHYIATFARSSDSFQ